MSKATVALLRTTPRTVLADYHELLNLARYQEVLDKSVDTALKINISWHFFYPGELHHAVAARGCDRGDEARRLRPGDLIHGCHNRTVVIDAHLGERENKQLPVVRKHGLRNVHLYEGERVDPDPRGGGDLPRSSWS